MAWEGNFGLDFLSKISLPDNPVRLVVLGRTLVGWVTVISQCFERRSLVFLYHFLQLYLVCDEYCWLGEAQGWVSIASVFLLGSSRSLRDFVGYLRTVRFGISLSSFLFVLYVNLDNFVKHY